MMNQSIQQSEYNPSLQMSNTQQSQMFSGQPVGQQRQQSLLLQQVQMNNSQLEQDFLVRIKNYHLPPCPKHSLLDEESAQVCLKQDCPRYLELSCSECLRLEHLEPMHTTRSFINFKLFLARLLELVDSKRQMREQCQQMIVPHLDSNRQTCQQIIDVAQQIQEEARNNMMRQEQFILGGGSQLHDRTLLEESTQERQVRGLLAEVLQNMDREQLQATLLSLRPQIEVLEGTDYSIQLQRGELRNGGSVYMPPNYVEEQLKRERMCQLYDRKNDSIMQRLNALLMEFRNNTYENLRGIQTQELYFSLDKKAHSIMVDRLFIAHQTRHEEFQRFVLVEPQLQTQQTRRWAIKIHELKEWIGIGVCHPSIICQQNYEFDVNSLGHGYYMVSHNGFTWSHDNVEEQCKQKGFTFTTGDIIYVEFDPLARKVRFTKNNTRNAVEITLSAGMEDFTGCANLGGAGDCVEILQNTEF